MMTTITMRNICKAMNIAIRGANCQRQYGGFLLPTRTNLKIIPAERQIIQFIVRCKAVLHFILICGISLIFVKMTSSKESNASAKRKRENKLILYTCRGK